MYFKVIVHGDGIYLDEDRGAEIFGASDPATGFFATRKVRAKNQVCAIEAAKEIIMKEWISGKYSSINSGGIPKLDVDRIYRINLFRYLVPNFPTKGNTFYSEP